MRGPESTAGEHPGRATAAGRDYCDARDARAASIERFGRKRIANAVSMVRTGHSLQADLVTMDSRLAGLVTTERLEPVRVGGDGGRHGGWGREWKEAAGPGGVWLIEACGRWRLGGIGLIRSPDERGFKVYTCGRRCRMSSTVRKWGNSLGVRIPKSLAEQVNVREGTEVEFDTSGGVLTIRPKKRRRFTLARLLSKAKGQSPHRELDRGGPRGGELI